jgi:uncharacterized membrane protein YbhN (UPF0104 family)
VNGFLLHAVKWLWIVSLFVAVGWYAQQHTDRIWTSISTLSVRRLASAALLIIIGKVVLVDVVRKAIATTGHRFTFRQVASMTMSSQPAKYLPGGVWHFVGRAGLYTSRGMSLSESSRAIALEQVWLLTSALCFGGILAFVALGKLLSIPEWLSGAGGRSLVVAALGAAWYAAMHVSDRLLGKRKSRQWRSIAVNVAEQALVWTLMGLAFRILIPGGSPVTVTIASVGAFALGWAVGYIAIFAPGGIGVREAAIVTILSPLLPTEQAAVAAVVNRGVWASCELILGGIAVLFVREPTHGRVEPPGSISEREL